MAQATHVFLRYLRPLANAREIFPNPQKAEVFAQHPEGTRERNIADCNARGKSRRPAWQGRLEKPRATRTLHESLSKCW
jgi:hypothetical protein